MSRYISDELRQLVIARADFLCEYCLIHEDDTLFGCEVDHVISIKHSGQTEADNLAYACVFCNRHKGSDLGSLLRRTGELIRFFNPRLDRWANHFYLDGVLIKPRTDIGEVTEQIFDFNRKERILERQALSIVGRYPVAAALSRTK